MWKACHRRQIVSCRRAVAALQAVMILSVCLIILLGMQFLWNPKYGGAEGLFTAAENKVKAVMNGGEETESQSNNSDDNNSGGDSDDDEPSGPHENTNGGGDSGGQDGNGGDDTSNNGNDDHDSGSSGNNSGEDDPDSDPDDDGHLDPLWEKFPEDLAKALAGRVAERRMETLKQVVKDAASSVSETNAVRDAAAARLQQALRDPDLSPLRRLELENEAAASRIASQNARIAMENAEEARKFAARMNQQFTRSVAMLGATQTLLDADKKRQELIQQGRFDEAWRVSLGGAMRTVSEAATGFTDKLPGIGGSIASEAINTAAEMAGRNLADNSFPAMVDLSHWLYGQSWWPKDIRPRFPPGYRPPQKK